MIAVFTLAALLLAAAQGCPAPTETPNPQPFRLEAPKATIALRVANTPGTREYGLMCVRQMPPHTGMIFVFRETDEAQPFWMKNTLIPLDQVWIRRDGVVTTVAADVPATSKQHPGELTNRQGVGSYVLELNAGEAAADGIIPGLKLPVDHVPPAME